MTVKYGRDDFRTRALGIGPSDKKSPSVGPHPKQRLRFINFGLAACTAFLFLLYLVHPLNRPSSGPLLSGEGIVRAKQFTSDPQGATKYFLDIEITLDDNSRVSRTIETDPVSWARVSEGDLVDVTYRFSFAPPGVIVTDVSLHSPGPDKQGITQAPGE